MAWTAGIILVVVGIGTSTSEPDEPSTLRIGAALPSEAEVQIGFAQLASALRSDSLIALSNDGRVAPRLAKSWRFSPDAKDLTFFLRANARFHDGTRADASSVARLVADELSRPQLLRTFPMLSHIYSVEPGQNNSIVVRSRSARVLMLDDLANVTLGRNEGSPALGPYVVDRVSAEGVVAHGFSDYYLGNPAIGRVELRAFRSLRSAWSAMMRGEIDALYEVNRESVEFVERERRVRVYPFLRQYVANLLFNVRRPQFADPKIRKALSHIVDRGAIVRSAYRGRGRVADGPLWPEHWALQGSSISQEHNRSAALKVLRQRPVETAPGKMPARLRFTCLVVDNFESQPFERMALVLQKQLYEVGVDMQLQSVTVAEAIRLLFAGEYDAALFEYGGRSPSALYGIWHSPAPGTPAFVRTGYSAADEELDAMQMARDEAELRWAVADVYSKMHDDPPAIFIAWPEAVRAVSTQFEAPIQRGSDPLGANLPLWRPASLQETTP